MTRSESAANASLWDAYQRRNPDAPGGCLEAPWMAPAPVRAATPRPGLFAGLLAFLLAPVPALHR